jgi:hypothetical protein
MKTFEKLSQTLFSINNSEKKFKPKTPTFSFWVKFDALNSQKKSNNFFDVIYAGFDISVKKHLFHFLNYSLN